MRTLTLAAILICTSGCSTIGSFVGGEELWLYSGSRRNVNVWTPGKGPRDCTGLMGLCAIADFPFSLALDTALAPLTLPLELLIGGAAAPQGGEDRGKR